MSEPPRLVVIAPFVPKRLVDNAGQRYLGELARALSLGTVFIVPKDDRSSRDAAAAGDQRVLLVDVAAPPPPRTRVGRAYQFSRARAVPIRARDGFWGGLQADEAAREALAQAEIVDLQWPEFVSLVSRIRRVAPRARLVATMHDIPSQGKARELRAAIGARSSRGAVRLAAAVAQARLLELRVAAQADLVVVFSDKDRLLMPARARTAVVNPPATSAWDVAHHRGGDLGARPVQPLQGDAARRHAVLSLGSLLRPENCDGLEWFGRDVLPLVTAEVPDARLIHAGTYDDNQVRRLEGVAVELLGFVPDLAGLQSQVGVTIAPVRFGAGVKFKVIDALFDGLPIVSTSVGTEGIGDGSFRPESFDTPVDFARAVVEALAEPTSAAVKRREAREWARYRFGWPQFERSVDLIYGSSDTAPSLSASHLAGVQLTGEPRPSRVAAGRRHSSASVAGGGRLRIGLLTPWDINDERSWSGMIVRMREELGRDADVVPLSTVEERTAGIDRALARALGRFSKRRYLWEFGIATAWRRGKAARRRVIAADLDVVLAVVASPDVAFLRVPDVPVVQVVDTTFCAVRNFYPQFTNLHPLSSWQALRVTNRGNRATSRFLASTQWAIDALVADSVPSSNVLLAPPGPATVPPDGWSRSDRRCGNDLRILLVASDWERKGGDVAVGAVRLVRERGIDATLTVVGDAPPLPDWVKCVGRLDRRELADQYEAADVLLELASANAAGVTLTDAAAHGLGVVATDVGGVRTIVVDGVTGTLVSAGPGVERLAADALVQFVDPEFRSSVSLAANKHYYANLHWRHWTETVMRACRSAMADVGQA